METDHDEGVIYAPWERGFKRLLTPFEEFIHRQTTSGLLLMVTALIALGIANSGLAEPYVHLLHLPIGFEVGDWALRMSLHHWVNDGLMALFFFVVGMELKREILVGELADLRQAALPIVAAIGGMVVPALIYLVLNPDAEAARGWGIPMATDIAFAVGVLVLLASRVPKALITFLVALAIVDDLGAVLVIAIFYTKSLSLAWVAVSALLVATLALFNLAGIRKVVPYFLVAVLLWYALLQSGVLSAMVKSLVARFDASNHSDRNIMTNDELRSIVQSLGHGALAVQTPLQRLEHVWHLPVAFLIIPVFALVNAGIPLPLSTLAESALHPITLGVMLGLVLGKFIGITGASALALRLGLGQLPSGTRFAHIAAVSLLAGIGFTMSIFIAELGFAEQPDALLKAKTGVLGASLLSGTLGFAWLWVLGRPAR